MAVIAVGIPQDSIAHHGGRRAGSGVAGDVNVIATDIGQHRDPPAVHIECGCELIAIVTTDIDDEQRIDQSVGVVVAGGIDHDNAQRCVDMPGHPRQIVCRLEKRDHALCGGDKVLHAGKQRDHLERR